MRYTVLWALALLAGPAHADPAICEQAAQRAERDFQIPTGVMRAITLTETGRNRDGTLRPWPWTVNLEGTGHWFDTRAEAEAFAEEALAQGRTSFDIGCFQLNWRWHGDAFASITAMFDPAANAEYAANYLKSHFETLGTWTRAAGRYHSGTPQYATRYAARFEAILADLPDTVADLAPAPERQSAGSVFFLTRATGPLLTRATGPMYRR